MEKMIINGYDCKVIAYYEGLSNKEIEAVVSYSMNLTFDFLRYADEIEVTCTRKSDGIGEAEALISGSSEIDERGNGYFGYPIISLSDLVEEG